MKKLLVAQSGGPTAAINATLAGVVQCAYSSGKVETVLGAINGIKGVLEERFLDLGQHIRSVEDFSLLCQTPAAALGSCRLKIRGTLTAGGDCQNTSETWNWLLYLHWRKRFHGYGGAVVRIL